MKRCLPLILSCLLFASCEKLLMPDDSPATATATFDYLWHQIDKRYSMFDVKQVDWQAVYDSLRPKVYDGMKSDSLFTVCATMLNTLHDGHVNLFNAYNTSHSDSIYYRFYADDDIDVDALVLTYLTPGYRTTGGMAHAPLRDGQVLYIRYASFGSAIGVSQFRHIIHSYPNARGMILDMRGNGGGDLSNVYNILSLMPSHGQKLYSSQIKSGPGRNDFTPLADTYAPQVADSDAYTLPVIVLIDRGCFSATSTFAICTQAYDNIRLMGDTTSGGTGLPTMGVLPNGWRYRYSVTRTLALNGANYENGVPPDIPLRLNRQAALDSRRDNIIDSACNIILTPQP